MTVENMVGYGWMDKSLDESCDNHVSNICWLSVCPIPEVVNNYDANY